MAENSQKWSKMAKNGRKWSKMAKNVKNGHISISKIYASNGEVGGSNGEVRRMNRFV